MKTDIEIAQAAKLKPIRDIAAKIGLSDADLEFYGNFKAKINRRPQKGAGGENTGAGAKKGGKLILVTAINPTPAGEGKTTTSIGLSDALNRLGHKSVLALREPSLGPVFGVKGGAAGGGYAQVVPMEDINLHFTGDFHAIGAANNLLAALIDNHIHQGNALSIDPRKITWRRCVDMNDRQLRNIVSGLGGKTDGVPREDGYDITVASEVMAVLCLCADLDDLKNRLGKIIVGFDYSDRPVTAWQLKAGGAMAALLKDALKPNLVQTLEHNPAIIHGGPFANIAHGCNSVIATRTALELGEYAVTEAGFGADLGAEKFLDLKCRASGLKPAAVVIVATARALKFHGGAAKGELARENLPALRAGLPNLIKHIENITSRFKLPAVVAVNRFPTDTDKELELIKSECAKLKTPAALSEVWAKGGEGGLELAEEVVRLAAGASDAAGKGGKFNFIYPENAPFKAKLEAVARDIYGADGVDYSPKAEAQIKKLAGAEWEYLPVCVAKTQYSLSDDAAKLGRPKNFRITVREIRVSAGAGFVVAVCGDIMTMPGLPKVPAAESIDIDGDGKITGLF